MSQGEDVEEEKIEDHFKPKNDDIHDSTDPFGLTVRTKLPAPSWRKSSGDTTQTKEETH